MTGAGDEPGDEPPSNDCVPSWIKVSNIPPAAGNLAEVAGTLAEASAGEVPSHLSHSC